MVPPGLPPGPGEPPPDVVDLRDGRGPYEQEGDVAVAAWREEGEWVVSPLPPTVTGHLRALVVALRQLPADAGALALLTLADDGFLLVREVAGRTGLLVADTDAAEDCALGREAVHAVLGTGAAGAGDGAWLGDLGLLADLGVAPVELRSLCEDEEAYPDERLGLLAEHLGMGRAFARALAAAG